MDYAYKTPSLSTTGGKMSDPTKFAIGDIVRLKSGGPEMTVKSLPDPIDWPQNYYRCQWFAGKKLESGTFPPDSLELVNNAAS
jgi:uncharacterized protein YodC (DUF2158 family)